MHRLALALTLLAAPASAQERYYPTAEQALNRAAILDDQTLYAQRDRLLPGQCDIQPGSGLAQVSRFAVAAHGAGFLPVLRVPCTMSIRNFHDVAFIEDGAGLRPLVAEVPVIAIGTNADGLHDWRKARIEGFVPSPILAEFEIDPSGTSAWFAVPQALGTGAIVAVQVAIPSMTILTVTASSREGGESVNLIDNRR